MAIIPTKKSVSVRCSLIAARIMSARWHSAFKRVANVAALVVESANVAANAESASSSHVIITTIFQSVNRTRSVSM